MPIYEYRCGSCDEHFELIVRSSTVLRCPRCESESIDRQISAFSVGSGSPAYTPPTEAACEGCPSARACGRES